MVDVFCSGSLGKYGETAKPKALKPATVHSMRQHALVAFELGIHQPRPGVGWNILEPGLAIL